MRIGWRYGLTGLVLTALLVGSVFFARLANPPLPSSRLAANFPRAKGPVDAPIQIIEYSDFQCPACGKAQPLLARLLAEYPEKIRLIYQHFPLDGHPWSGLAHQTAECAAQQNRFWSLHDQLYAEQSDWSKSPESPLETFMKYAAGGGVDLPTFSQCLTDPNVTKKIREEKLAGEDLGVRSTPTFFVNGEAVVGELKLREKVVQLMKR